MIVLLLLGIVGAEFLGRPQETCTNPYNISRYNISQPNDFLEQLQTAAELHDLYCAEQPYSSWNMTIPTQKAVIVNVLPVSAAQVKTGMWSIYSRVLWLFNVNLTYCDEVCSSTILPVNGTSEIEIAVNTGNLSSIVYTWEHSTTLTWDLGTGPYYDQDLVEMLSVCIVYYWDSLDFTYLYKNDDGFRVRLAQILTTRLTPLIPNLKNAYTYIGYPNVYYRENKTAVQLGHNLFPFNNITRLPTDTKEENTLSYCYESSITRGWFNRDPYSVTTCFNFLSLTGLLDIQSMNVKVFNIETIPSSDAALITRAYGTRILATTELRFVVPRNRIRFIALPNYFNDAFNSESLISQNPITDVTIVVTMILYGVVSVDDYYRFDHVGITQINVINRVFPGIDSKFKVTNVPRGSSGDVGDLVRTQIIKGYNYVTNQIFSNNDQLLRDNFTQILFPSLQTNPVKVLKT